MVCTYLKWWCIAFTFETSRAHRETYLVHPNLKTHICTQFYHVKKMTLSAYCVDCWSLRIKAIIRDIFTSVTVWRNISDISFKRKIKMNVLFDLIFPSTHL